MDKGLAKQILTDYVFDDFSLDSIKEKYVDKNIKDETTRKLYAESLLSNAIKEGVMVLRKEMEADAKQKGKEVNS